MFGKDAKPKNDALSALSRDTSLLSDGHIVCSQCGKLPNVVDYMGAGLAHGIYALQRHVFAHIEAQEANYFITGIKPEDQPKPKIGLEECTCQFTRSYAPMGMSMRKSSVSEKPKRNPAKSAVNRLGKFLVKVSDS